MVSYSNLVESTKNKINKILMSKEEDKSEEEDEYLKLIITTKVDDSSGENTVRLMPRIAYPISYENMMLIIEQIAKYTSEHLPNGIEKNQKEHILKELIEQIKKAESIYFSEEEIKGFFGGLQPYSNEEIDTFFTDNKQKLKLTNDINKLKNDPNNKIRFNVVILKAIMKFVEKQEFEEVLKQNNELKNEFQELVNICINSIYETLYRPLKTGQKRSNEEGLYLNKGGYICFKKDAILDRNKIELLNLYKQTKLSEEFINTAFIQRLLKIYTKYEESGKTTYEDNSSALGGNFDKLEVKKLLTHLETQKITKEQIEPFFKEIKYHDINTNLPIKNPVTKSLINHANLNEDACIFIIKELCSIGDINSIDLLFKNKKVIENNALYQTIIKTLREKPEEFKQHPLFLQKILEHINDFNMEQIKEIETLIEGSIPELVDKNTDPRLIALLIKNTDLTSSKNIEKAEKVFQKIIALDPNELGHKFPKIKQPIAVVLDSFIERVGDKNIENILLKDPSLLCNAIENNNVEVVEYCLKHGMFNLFFLEDKNRKNTPLQLINSKPGQRFDKMRSLIEKYKKELDDCQKQMEVEANKPKKPQPQPKPEVKNPQPKPKTEEEEKNEEQDARSNEKDINEMAQNLNASRKTKDVLEKLNKLSKYNETENIGEYKKIFSDFLLTFVYGKVIHTTTLNKTLELLVEKLSDAQKIMLFSTIACIAPETLPKVKGVFEKAVKPEQEQVYDKIYSKAKYLASLYEANQEPYHRRANRIPMGIRA